MPTDAPKAGETKEEYLKYCIPSEIKAGYPQDQAVAICISIYDRKELSKQKFSNPTERVTSKLAFDAKFEGINLINFDAPCYKDYEQIGTKILDGREVPNCVPKK